MRYATTEKVAVAWLSGVSGLSTAMVGATLPEDTSLWSATGFVTPAAVGGNPDLYLPFASPVVDIKCWAVDPGSGLPPWGAAENLAETVRAACYDIPSIGRFLTLPYCDQTARVLSAYPVQEPRRAYGDAGDYACVQVELALHWIIR